MSSISRISRGLFVGDYDASQDINKLSQLGITSLVSAMRQHYDTTLDILRIPVDDSPSANLIQHFPAARRFIRAALDKGDGVLVHCQAGVSRSATLVAAYLMAQEPGLDVDQALARIRKVRPQVEPTETFLHQLEMYERCECEWDPVKWSEQRRFLMGFAQAKIMDGASPSIVLAYYPSPSGSPSVRSPSDTHGDTLDAAAGPAASVPYKKRLTARTTEDVTVQEPTVVVEKIGTKGQVTVVGKRVSCKMCRRELAARDHILVHAPGMGQQAFAPHRRDMIAYRAELEHRRLDEIDREKLEAKQQDVAAEPSTTPPSSPPLSLPLPPPPASLPSGLAALRISTPFMAIPGLRTAVPRPRPPVARPQPMNRAAAGTTAPPALQLGTTVDASGGVASPIAPAEVVASTMPRLSSSEPPLLPSHLCSAYFVEPLSWMAPLLDSGILAGKIVCPGAKCGAKLGSYDWAGLQCSCGAWVCPGFALNVSKTDEVM